MKKNQRKQKQRKNLKETSSGNKAGSESKKEKRSSPAQKLGKVVHQFREPISLLSTFRQEGFSNALSFLSFASSVATQASKKVQFDSIGPALKDAIHSLGFVLRSDLEKLEERVEELELKLTEAESGKLEEE